MSRILTEKQAHYLELFYKHGESYAEVARQIGCSTQNAHNVIKVAMLKQAKSGHAQNVEKHVPAGYAIKGTSTLVDVDGNAKLTWVKTQQDREAQLEALQVAVDTMKEDLNRLPPMLYAGAHHDQDLCNLFVITDYHLGALCWGEETGGDWDVEIAEHTLMCWFENAISRAPKAGTAILGQIGDFLHWDGIESVTPTSGHILDADTRYQKLIRVAIRVVRKVIDMLLYEHKDVHVIMAEGNHDITGSMWLSELFAELYADEPRVTIDTRPDPYYCFEFGDTSLFFHHGHKKPMKNISDVFVSKFRQVFGRTKHSYGHMGHLHHNVILENNLMTVEQHRTLAAPDAHASRGGWLSGRDSKVITYHKKYGEVSRLTVNIDMLK